MSAEQVKVMYYAPLPEGRTHAAFRPRWREHGELAMGLPFWRHMARYVQYDVLGTGDQDLGIEQLSGTRNADYGGVGAVWFHNLDALTQASADPDSDVMLADELETFGRWLGTDLVPTSEHVLLDRGPAPVTVMNALHRLPSVSRASFQEQWLAMGEQLLAKPELAGHLRTYVQDHALADAEGWDGIVEIGFAQTADFFAFMAEPLISEWLFPHETGFIDIPRGQPLITTPTLLYDGVSEA
jgi:EthD domain